MHGKPFPTRGSHNTRSLKLVKYSQSYGLNEVCDRDISNLVSGNLVIAD